MATFKKLTALRKWKKKQTSSICALQPLHLHDIEIIAGRVMFYLPIPHASKNSTILTFIHLRTKQYIHSYPYFRYSPSRIGPNWWASAALKIFNKLLSLMRRHPIPLPIPTPWIELNKLVQSNWYISVHGLRIFQPVYHSTWAHHEHTLHTFSCNIS